MFVLNENLGRVILALAACLLLSAASTAGQTTWYVDDDADPNGDGTTWLQPFNDLQDALAEAQAGDEIHVAGGTYVPWVLTDPNEPRTATFELVCGVALYGGYAGLADPNDPDFRDIALHETVLSGDLAGDDGPDFANRADNAYSIMTTADCDPSTIVDGLTFSGGEADGGWWVRDYGAGMKNTWSDPTITNCMFIDNRAYYGAGICDFHSSPTIIGCTFQENRLRGRASHWGGGAGICNRSGSSPTVTACLFYANRTRTTGAGMYNWGDCNPIVTDCSFVENELSGVEAVVGSAGVDNDDHSEATLVNCSFIGNVSEDWGGALGNYWYSHAAVIDCTFTGNSAERGGAVYNSYSSPMLINCTFDGNMGEFGGGAMRSDYSAPLVEDCKFSDNVAAWGGAVHDYWSAETILSRCLFIGNSATSGAGGAIRIEHSQPCVRNCIFLGNSARRGGAICASALGETRLANCAVVGNVATESCGGMLFQQDYTLPQPWLVNCIVWGNSDPNGTGEAAQILDPNGTADVNFCCVQGWTGSLGGVGNIGDDPLFVDPDGPDNDPNTWDDNDYRLFPGSPCIDAGWNNPLTGDPTDLDNDGDRFEFTPYDLDGENRFVDDPNTLDTGMGCIPIVDMGAYEFGEVGGDPCLGDLDCDRVVGLGDLGIVLGAYGSAGGVCAGDVDGDGDVDLSDLAALLAVYGRVCP